MAERALRYSVETADTETLPCTVARMASWTPSTTRHRPALTAPDQNELITRLHDETLGNTLPLRERLTASASHHSRVQAEATSSDSDFTPSKSSKSSKPLGRRAGHSRSMSNPFPSFLGGRRKRAPSKPSVDLDASDDDDIFTPRGAGARAHQGGPPLATNKDFATGNCMTCASLMRWPKEVKVFKCTICLTINDLVRLERDTQATVGRQRPGTSQGPPRSGLSMTGRVRPISLDHTKYLVRQCLRAYISRRLRTLTPNHTFESALQADQTQQAPDRLRPGSSSWQLGRQDPHSPSHSMRPTSRGPVLNVPLQSQPRSPSTSQSDDPRRIFKPLEDYIAECFSSFECLNSSFFEHHPRPISRCDSEPRRNPDRPKAARPLSQIQSASRGTENADPGTFDLDPRLLLLGDVAENGMWWTGGQNKSKGKAPAAADGNFSESFVLTKTPQVNWHDVQEWYSTINNAAEDWFTIYNELSEDGFFGSPTESDLQALEQDLLRAQLHAQRSVLRGTELLLKRPGRPLNNPADLRFLLIIMENPELYSDTKHFQGLLQPERNTSERLGTSPHKKTPHSVQLLGQHSGIVKRLIGLLSNSSTDCHNQMISWLVRYPSSRFAKVKELVSGFLTYRMVRQSEKRQDTRNVDVTAGLIPQMAVGRSGASLHDEVRSAWAPKNTKGQKKFISYVDDWQIKAASRVLALVFAANNILASRRANESGSTPSSSPTTEHAHARGMPLPASDFYNSMIDYADLVGDFESWESRSTTFSFCQYPFLLSIWAKTQILEYDTRRQMQSKARDAFFDSIMTRRNINQYLLLDVRRECLVDDSLQTVSEVIGSGGEDLKKGLRISFRGEEGIDAGGLRKEWFLLLVREVFNPDHGMFVYDEDSRYCYFNPNSFEASDQFFLVGVVMGLAIYNSTILDVALPPFAFRKLIASAPSPAGAVSAHQRSKIKHTLEDLAEYRPRLASGLKQLLQYDGDVEETFCLDFVVDTDKYGTKVPVPLCPGGENKPVTNANRREYVDLYVRYILETAVKRQFEPFKRGFYTVCGGNAFSLFRPEEIELLVRGSDEPLDIASLRAVAEYDGWTDGKPDGTEPVVSWFWESIQQATPRDQRKLLLFITGSDRIPAMGAASLVIKLTCLGGDCGRYPIARTCFNLLSLWRYDSREKLEAMLWRAVHESEGFGLK